VAAEVVPDEDDQSAQSLVGGVEHQVRGSLSSRLCGLGGSSSGRSAAIFSPVL
jgi:hypothetical protein